MLKAVPAGWPSSIFVLYENDTAVGSLNVKAVSSDLTLQGSVYRLYRKGIIKGEYYLLSGEGVIAAAKHAGMLSGVIVIEHGARKYHLKPGGIFSGSFSLFEDDKRIGHFSQQGRDFMADLSKEIPLAVRVFILWLMLQIWMAAAGVG